MKRIVPVVLFSTIAMLVVSWLMPVEAARPRIIIGPPVVQVDLSVIEADIAALKAANESLKSRLNLKTISRVETATQSPWHLAIRVDETRIISNDSQSNDNGKTWTSLPQVPDFASQRPTGWRLNRVTTAKVGTRLMTPVNTIDADLGPSPEPSAAVKNYYLRYRVSIDGGLTWLFDEQIICDGQTAQQPFPGVTIGTNAIYLGDIGCIPIVVGETVLVPAQITVLAANGQTLLSPGGTGFWFFDTAILRGTWGDDNRLTWTVVRIPGDATKSIRGFFEPTLVQLSDGRILCVMRGSNGGLTDPQYQLSSRKWASWSSDGGLTWTVPVAWTYDTGAPLVSPSSMSSLFKDSRGRIWWCGNDSLAANVNGSLPRYPLVVIEVDSRTGLPIASSRVPVDWQTTADMDPARGRLDIAHGWLSEAADGSLVLTYPRYWDTYKKVSWIEMRLRPGSGQ